jgi:hypothetical protein
MYWVLLDFNPHPNPLPSLGEGIQHTPLLSLGEGIKHTLLLSLGEGIKHTLLPSLGEGSRHTLQEEMDVFWPPLPRSGEGRGEGCSASNDAMIKISKIATKGTK